VAAALAGLSTALGAALVFAAVVATRRLWFAGYVSEAGIASGLYRVGVVVLAAGLVLLAVAVLPAVPVAAWLLGAAGGLAAVSGAVTCSAGCPLPPYEPATVADVVHGAASALAVGACTLAMGAIAAARKDRSRWLWGAGDVDARWRRVSTVAFWVVGPLVAAAGTAMLTVGRGYVTGLLERTILLAVTAWLLATSALLTRRPG